MLSPSLRERSIVEFLEFFIASTVSSHSGAGGANNSQAWVFLSVVAAQTISPRGLD